MGRAPCRSVSEEGLNKGPWTEEEDAILGAFIKANGEGNWRTLPKQAGLLRCRKSCRLRWMNYLRPDLKRGNFSADEDELIIKLHSLLGNRWSMIAGRIPGRTDNEIKNYWNSRLRRKLRSMEGDLSQLFEATPLVVDLATEVKLGGPLNSSTHSDIPAPLSHPPRNVSSEATTHVASFPDYGDIALDSSNFPDYARFHANSCDEATPSEPSSDGTYYEDYDYQSLKAGYYSAWTPGLDEVAEDLIPIDSVKRESYAYSPESVLNFLPQGDPEDDFLLSTDFACFTAGLSDFGETNFHKLLQPMPLSPVQKNWATLSWPIFQLERLQPYEFQRL